MPTRPFQFGISNLLVATLVAAVIAWLVRHEEPGFQVLAALYLLVGCGQISAMVAVLRRPHGAGSPVGEDHKRARDMAVMNLFLTMPSWVMLIVRLAVKPDMAAAIDCLSLVLHGTAAVFNLFSWLVYFRPLEDWRLDMLRLLNAANTTLLLGLVFFIWRQVYLMR